MAILFPKSMYSYNLFRKEAKKLRNYKGGLNTKGVKYTSDKKFYKIPIKGFTAYSIENRLGKTLWLDAKRFKKEYPKLI